MFPKPNIVHSYICQCIFISSTRVISSASNIQTHTYDAGEYTKYSQYIYIHTHIEYVSEGRRERETKK